MEAFRLVRSKYSNELSGVGAALKGARWNSVGVELIYCASNRSLAMAEVLVHLTLPSLPKDYMILTIYVPDNIPVLQADEKEFSENWNSFPSQSSTQFIGDRFVAENKYCILKIPSVITKGDFNILINPHHKSFKKIKIIDCEQFPFDRRLFK